MGFGESYWIRTNDTFLKRSLFNRYKFFEKKNWQLKILIILFLVHIAFIMIKDHPHQNVYFNFLAGKNIQTKFELDYWGLSNKQALEYILKNDSKNVIRIGSAGPISIENSKQILSSLEKNRISISKNLESDYIIDNYINWYGRYKKKDMKYQIISRFIKKFLLAAKE